MPCPVHEISDRYVKYRSVGQLHIVASYIVVSCHHDVYMGNKTWKLTPPPPTDQNPGIKHKVDIRAINTLQWIVSFDFDCAPQWSEHMAQLLFMFPTRKL